MKRNGYFTFQMIIIDILTGGGGGGGGGGAAPFFRYAWIAEVLFEQFLIRNAV